MNKKTRKLDEFQEQKLLKIEHNGMWFAFWALLASILIQVIISESGEIYLRSIAPEWLIFMCLCVYLGGACLKNGIWSTRTEPNSRTNLITSLITGAVCAIVLSLATYIRMENLKIALIAGSITLVIMSALTYLVFLYVARAYRKRVNKLESEGND